MRPVNLTLPESTVAQARNLGDGSASQGIRIAVDEAVRRRERRRRS